MPMTNDPVYELISSDAGPANVDDPLPTLRDLFAIHAPVKAPSWFHHKAPFEVPPVLREVQALEMVPGSDVISDQARKLILEWLQDGTYEMEQKELEGLAHAAARLLDESRAKRQAVMEANEAATWFAWRWHYATTMMRTRESLL